MIAVAVLSFVGFEFAGSKDPAFFDSNGNITIGVGKP